MSVRTDQKITSPVTGLIRDPWFADHWSITGVPASRVTTSSDTDSDVADRPDLGRSFLPEHPFALIGSGPCADITIPASAPIQSLLIGTTLGVFGIDLTPGRERDGRTERWLGDQPEEGLAVGELRVVAPGDDAPPVTPLTSRPDRVDPPAVFGRIRVRFPDGKSADCALTRPLTLIGSEKPSLIRVPDVGLSAVSLALLRTPTALWAIRASADRLDFGAEGAAPVRLGVGSTISAGALVIEIDSLGVDTDLAFCYERLRQEVAARSEGRRLTRVLTDFEALRRQAEEVQRAKDQTIERLEREMLAQQREAEHYVAKLAAELKAVDGERLQAVEARRDLSQRADDLERELGRLRGEHQAATARLAEVGAVDHEHDERRRSIESELVAVQAQLAWVSEQLDEARRERDGFSARVRELESAEQSTMSLLGESVDRADREKQDRAEDLARLERRVEELLARIGSLETELGEERHRHDLTTRELTVARQRLLTEHESLRRDLDVARQRITDLNGREAELAGLRESLARTEADRADLADRLASLGRLEERQRGERESSERSLRETIESLRAELEARTSAGVTADETLRFRAESAEARLQELEAERRTLELRAMPPIPVTIQRLFPGADVHGDRAGELMNRERLRWREERELLERTVERLRGELESRRETEPTLASPSDLGDGEEIRALRGELDSLRGEADARQVELRTALAQIRELKEAGRRIVDARKLRERELQEAREALAGLETRLAGAAQTHRTELERARAEVHDLKEELAKRPLPAVDPASAAWFGRPIDVGAAAPPVEVPLVAATPRLTPEPRVETVADSGGRMIDRLNAERRARRQQLRTFVTVWVLLMAVLATLWVVFR